MHERKEKTKQRPTFEDFREAIDQLDERQKRLVLVGVRYMQAHKGASVDECLAYALAWEKEANGNV